MARTALTEKGLRNAVFDKTKLENLQTKLAEHDTAIDALEGGTTSSIVTIHPVRAASTTNVTLTSVSTTMDTSVTLVAGDRVLVKDQSNAAQNGIYVVGTVSGGNAPFTRATDWDAAAEIKANTFVVVTEGTLGVNTLWQLVADFPTVVGTSHQHFTQVLNKTQLAAYLALTTQAGLIGSDAAGYSSATVKGQLAEVKVLADAGVGAVKRTVTVAETELSGTSQAVNIGAALPANAIVFMHEIVVNTQGVLAGNDLTITIGGTDADAIVASTDLDALTTGKYQGTLGVHPRGSFASEQLVATFAASDLATLSAGNWTINVWYFVLA